MDENAKHHNKIFFRIALVVVSIFIIIAAEFMSGVFYDYITPYSGRLAVKYMLTRRKQWKEVSFIPHPYMLYVNTPFFEKAGYRQINSMGYRGEEITPKPKPGTTRILTIGGSTTYGIWVDRPSQAWPKQLEKMLGQKRNVEVVNGGLVDATSAELLAHYMFRDRYLESEIVVIHMGGNDARALPLDYYNPEHTHFRSGRISLLNTRSGEKFLLQFNIPRVFYTWWLRGFALHKLIQNRDFFQIMSVDAALNYAKKNEPAGFRRNLDLLVRNIIQDGAIPVLFNYLLVPQRDRAGYIGNHYEAFSIAVGKSLNVMKEIAGKYNLTVINIPDNAIPLEEFYDFCHLKVKGHTIKAQYAAGKLAPIIEGL